MDKLYGGGETRNRQTSSGSNFNAQSMGTVVLPDTTMIADTKVHIGSPIRKGDGHVPTGTTGGTFVNIFKNVVGSGMLAVPYTFSLSGWGLILALLGGILMGALLNVFFIIKSCEFVKAQTGEMPGSFQALAEAAFPNHKRAAGRFIEAVVGCYTFCTLIAFGVLIGQLFTKPFDGVVLVSNKYFVLGVASFILVPLCTMPSVEALKPTSIAGNMILAYTVTLIVYNAFTFTTPHAEEGGAPGHTPEYVDDLAEFSAVIGGTGLLQALPTLLFGFNFHYNAPMFYRELQERSIAKMSRIVVGCYFIISIFYLSIGFAGYYSYGHQVQSNIINNLPDRISTKFCQVLMGCMIICTFPVVQYACRGAMYRLFASEESSESTPFIKGGGGGGGVGSTMIPLQKRIVLSCATVGAALVIAAVVPNIGVVLAFNGALFGVGQQYFAPSICFYRLSQHTDTPQALRRLSLFMFMMGFVVMGLGVFGTITNLVKGNSR